MTEAKVIYASGSKGKSIRGNGNCGTMARGWYAKIERGGYRGQPGGMFGPFATKTEANRKAFGQDREPR